VVLNWKPLTLRPFGIVRHDLEKAIGRSFIADVVAVIREIVGRINQATKSLAEKAVQLRGATQSLIQRLQAA
jgi:hypothetical protein